jgi:hypothetical protein
MKTENPGLEIDLNEEQAGKLIKETKETITTGYTNAHAKPFSFAELWDIQRRRKNTSPRRNYM